MTPHPEADAASTGSDASTAALGADERRRGGSAYPAGGQPEPTIETGDPAGESRLGPPAGSTQPGGDDVPSGGPAVAGDRGTGGRVTPARQQYLDLKARHRDAILLYRLGDFYETFDDDARIAARELNLTLTSREFGRGYRVPMAGIPHHALNGYLGCLVRKGYRVAICEQLSEPGHGLVDRAVVRVVTAGTVVEPHLLRERANNYLAALWPEPVRMAPAGRRGGVPGRKLAEGTSAASATETSTDGASSGRRVEPAPAGYGLAWVDVTTGEFATAQLAGPGALDALRLELERLAPAEILLPEGVSPPMPLPGHVTSQPAHRFDPAAGRERLLTQLGVRTLDAFGCERLPLAIGAAGAILAYLELTDPALLPLLRSLRTATTGEAMYLDRHTRRNLELLQPAAGYDRREEGAAGELGRTRLARRNGATGESVGAALPGAAPRSLIATLDLTGTAMGGRLLRRWLVAPLLDRERIERRLEAVGELVAEPARRVELRAELARIGDLERLTARAAQGTASPRELLALAAGLRAAERLRRSLLGDEPAADQFEAVEAPVRDQVQGGEAPPLRELAGRLTPPADTAELIERATARGEPGDGALIRAGYSQALDELLAGSRDGKACIAELEVAERARTGIRSLKVGHNAVFGYFFEVTRPNLKHVPADWVRKQSLVNAERFISAELKDWETRVLGAAERIAELEGELWRDLLRRVGDRARELLTVAAAVAELDVYAALAEAADRYDYCRPLIEASDRIDIIAGRHPVVEAALPAHTFIPNDCHLAGDDCQIMLITGPNMAGKSTYLRQVALIVLMAQIGSFVPARAARIGLVDRIFTRIGAQDDIASGRSTFMVEMAETAEIVRQATPRSLILLDEVGRGTSTYDGVAIARAVVEHLHDRLGARTLFATHYHELTRLALELPRLHNFNVAVAEEGGEIVFHHRIVEGASDRSYGVQVARLAGMPATISERAEQVLRSLEGGAAPGPAAYPERHRHGLPQPAGEAMLPTSITGRPPFAPRHGVDAAPPPEGEVVGVLDELAALPIHNLTPMQAINKLFELQQRLHRAREQ